MRIMGFHFDGGFSDALLVPTQSLIPAPAEVAPRLVCFAEPVGCAIHALEKIGLTSGERIVIFGGGTVGLIVALVAATLGAVPVVIEKSAQKIASASAFLAATQIVCRRATTQSDFDAAVNACPDTAAFCQAMSKLAKSGRLAFFSGLSRNQRIDSHLLNRIHYQEGSITGAYGLTRENMTAALEIIRRHAAAFDLLVEAIVSPEQLDKMFPRVLAGSTFKFIVDMTGRVASGAVPHRGQPRIPPFKAASSPLGQTKGVRFQRTVDAVRAVSKDLLPAVRQKMDNKTKPLGALGRLEALAIQMCLIQRTRVPIVEGKSLLVFAADHGITEEGVSAYPAEVTGQMVANFLDGGAAINVLCRHHGIGLHIVDMGVNADIPPHPKLIDRKIRRGTRNFALQPAMSADEAIRAMEAGMRCFFDVHAAQPVQIVGLGEMGIGNTTSASAIISAATGISPEAATGSGTGVDDAGMRHKARVIRQALAYHRPDATDGLDILCKVGGLEIAGIAGAALAAASAGVAVVLDGVISTAAGLIAHRIQPRVGGYLISGHRSVEAAQAAALAQMGLTPVVDLEMRLGEGTGAALAIDIVAAACRIMNEMASFDDAGVSKRQ
jgi:nicotinate-nucleotide--dimethylbenzimidazole phosphoribosyltransferase